MKEIKKHLTEEHKRKISEAKAGVPLTSKAIMALEKRWYEDRVKRLKVLKRTCSGGVRIQYVLELMGEGLSYSEIGKDMGLTKQRVHQIIGEYCS